MLVICKFWREWRANGYMNGLVFGAISVFLPCAKSDRIPHIVHQKHKITNTAHVTHIAKNKKRQNEHSN